MLKKECFDLQHVVLKCFIDIVVGFDQSNGLAGTNTAKFPWKVVEKIASERCGDSQQIETTLKNNLTEERTMKNVISLSLLVAACLGTAMQVSANPLEIADGTYVFTETDGNNYCTGSTVTFANDQLTSWDIVDTLNSDTYLPRNSTYNYGAYEAGVYATDEFGYNIRAIVHASYGDPLVEIGWNSGVGYIYDNPEYGVPLDPMGTWTPLSVGVPDLSGTFQLLGGALLVLGAVRRQLSC